MRILIAEDDSVSRRVLTKTLAKWDHEIVVTGDGKAALEVMQAPDAPRLAILDWMMPEIDGIEVCRRIRSAPTSQPPYLILLTAKGGKENIVTGLEAGADDYITKPFDRDELKARINVGIRVVELVALRPRPRIRRRARQRSPAPGHVADLRLVQENSRRPELLAPGGDLHRLTLGGPFQPRHLPGLLQESHARRNKARPGRHSLKLLHSPFFAVP